MLSFSILPLIFLSMLNIPHVYNRNWRFSMTVCLHKVYKEYTFGTKGNAYFSVSVVYSEDELYVRLWVLAKCLYYWTVLTYCTWYCENFSLCLAETRCTNIELQRRAKEKTKATGGRIVEQYCYLWQSRKVKLEI